MRAHPISTAQMLLLLCAAVMGSAATAQQAADVCSDKAIIPVQRGIITDRNGVVLADSIKKEGESSPQRIYTFPRQLCHVLGRVDHTNKAKDGVEAYYHSHLSGVNGATPKAGLNLQLTIDMNLQKIAEEELDAGLRRFRAERGCMIVMDPKNGDILAMVNRPSYDLNTGEVITHNGAFAVGSIKDSRGKDITGECNMSCHTLYEPGAAFGVVTLASSLDQQLLSINSLVDCSTFNIPPVGPISDRPMNFGHLPVWGVLTKSSRPGTARIAMRSNWSKYKDYLEKFGLNKPVDIDLPGGIPCMISDGFNVVNFSRISYGYSIAVSPLHMAAIYATIANDGVRMKPRLVNRMTAADGTVYNECKPEEGIRVISSKTAADLRFALETVTRGAKENGIPVRRGTGTKAAIPGFRIGGKTGTTKKVKDGGSYYSYLYTVSFVGIFPIDDPKLVIITVIDEPQPTDCNPGGGTVAAPIFRAAAERMIQTLNLTPSDPEAYEQYLAEKAQGTTD